MNKEKGRLIIIERVKEFHANEKTLKKKGHGETNIRTNYIDVLFTALGWDMKSHHDVVREYSQKDRSELGGTKKVDYAFKINGRLKFFVEAKEASVDIENSKDAAYQAKRYAYSSNGKAPIVLLTDFEDLRVFNVLRAPNYDYPDREVIKSLSMHCDQYAENWDSLWENFSKDAVSQGSLEILKGTIDKNVKLMDADFLDQISSWRKILAEDLAKQNPELDESELNEAVQRILDRLIFVRNLEDREIESENLLLDLVQKTDNLYSKVNKTFRQLDPVYNGLLFKAHFSEQLNLSDDVLKKIIKSMCYPLSPFKFDVIEPEILGRVYEKFLGSKIELKKNHKIDITEKIEVRKAGGVFYTPEFIVAHMVAGTVGKIINGMTPDEITKIKIIDPACGSGSFLLGAFSYLLNYHEIWYKKNKSDKRYRHDYVVDASGELKVSLKKRGEILLNNLFGVDIDKEATEVATMSLYLKMLDAGFDKGQREMFFQIGHILPDMSQNIKCGNSLIGQDYLASKFQFDDDELRQVRPFDWAVEFPEVFRNGGFDCVLGNPPYVDVKILPGPTKTLLIEHYESADKRFDLYIPFVERSFSLINATGLVTFIMPTMFLLREYGSGIRRVIANKGRMLEIIHFGTNQIFENAKNYVGIFTISKAPSGATKVTRFIDCDLTSSEIELALSDSQKIDRKIAKFEVPSTAFPPESEWLLLSEKEQTLFSLFSNHPPLSTFLEFASEGIHSGKDEVFFITDPDLSSDSLVHRLAKGKDVHRYDPIDAMQLKYYVIYPYDLKTGAVIPENELRTKHAKLHAYLISQKRNLAGRPYFDNSSKKWYELWCQRDPQLYTEPKIIGPEITNGGNFTISTGQLFINNKLKSLVLKTEVQERIEYILGVLNSRLLTFLHRIIAPPKEHNYFEVKTAILGKLPIRRIDFSNQNDTGLHDQLVQLVIQMLAAKDHLIKAKSDSDRELYTRSINALDGKIDEVVYELYALTPDQVQTLAAYSPTT